jgi:ankyrin repeat protein
MQASYHGYLNLVKELVYRGAVMTLRNNEGMTALDLARGSNYKDVVAFLESQSDK